jgi:secondary thiamine-phosphate synthase enzyme
MGGGQNMKVVTRTLTFSTRGNCDLIDITTEVAREVSNSGLKDGILTIFVTGSTAGLTTIEYESGLISDFKNMWERHVPRDMTYQHDLKWGDGNGYSHVRASLQGASFTVPFNDKKLTLGTWQQIVLIDFDNRPRSRNIVLQLLGE